MSKDHREVQKQRYRIKVPNYDTSHRYYIFNCKSSSGVGVLLRHSDFSNRGAGGKVRSRRDDAVCLSAS